MNLLSKSFTMEGAYYNQLARKGSVALYEVREGTYIHYEVIIVKKEKEKRIGVVVYPECEVYPQEWEYGEFAWIPDDPSSKPSAYKLYSKIYNQWESGMFKERILW